MKLTDEAAAMITELLQDPSHPRGTGLRIAQRPDHTALAMAVADAPEPDDLVLTAQDALVFLAPIAQVRLEDATLDARHGELGPAFFLQP